MKSKVVLILILLLIVSLSWNIHNLISSNNSTVIRQNEIDNHLKTQISRISWYLSQDNSPEIIQAQVHATASLISRYHSLFSSSQSPVVVHSGVAVNELVQDLDFFNIYSKPQTLRREIADIISKKLDNNEIEQLSYVIREMQLQE